MSADHGRTEAPVNILLVDDKAENLLALESILEAPGYHLVRAQSGQDALLALLARRLSRRSFWMCRCRA